MKSLISIPLRYNLEALPLTLIVTSELISIPLRYNLEGWLLNLPAVDQYYFNSTKVQFGAVKLDRKYHINKGFEKRFR